MGKWRRVSAWTLGIFLLLMFVIGFLASREPDIFWVNRSADPENAIVGYSTVDTLIRVAETLLDKNCGYLTNDKLPPFVILDNIPSWELGVVNQLRDLGRVMRDDYTRSQSQSKEDPDVAEGAPKFFYDNNSWVFPTTESEYRDGIEFFQEYRERLVAGDPGTVFYARADNLREWLSQVEKRLGSLTRRLGNSVARSRINEDLAGETAAEAAGSQPDTVDVRTSWWKTDNIFFEARGTAWALVHFFRAAEFDFAHVLQDKNAEASVRQIIRELEASLATLRSPMILNGGGYGLTANHSLVMANYLARANAAVINLRELLDQG
ncbi:MAG: DUF2333 family protein [Gammaproteobacteria bacterium]|nr:DUF2333 family protein [Gammaproteobacteria bacterium]MBT8106313.1 DUF2333 family protein [Gammaproteobacteria bacterium]NNF48511.1 DUF2333 family protein [Woeseiaceae bacterium]NNK26327.1 DUF2333 family protein [Woeseiaceae bacterium]NNL63086.1 DUF2333 family protein [Woeseiaceae bacterium]